MSSMRRHILLAEMYYLKTLLLEGRIDFLKTKFLPIIRQKLENESHGIPQAIRASFPPVPPETDIEDLHEIDATNLFDYVLDRDPDPTKKNSQWLLTLITRKNHPMPLEDLIYAGETLTKFERMKKNRQIPQGRTDINAYKSLSDLEAVVEGKKKEIVQAQDAEMQKAFDESEVLLNDSHAMVVIPKTQFAAMYWARPATWCTGWGDPKGRMPHREHNYFEPYNRLGPLYVIHIKPTNEWYQFHEQNKELNDSENRYLTQNPKELASVLKDNPDVVQAIGEEKLANAFIEILGPSFWSKQAISDMDPLKLIKLVKSKEDFEALPDTVKYNPILVAGLVIRYKAKTPEIIHSQYITPGVIEELKKQAKHSRDAQQAFSILNIPIREWPPEAIAYATHSGTLTYAQYMQLPEEDRSEDQLKALIEASARKNPDIIKTYPPGLIKELGLVADICRDNPFVLQYLSQRDLTQDAVNEVAKNLDTRQLAYIPPEMLTDSAIKAFIDSHGGSYSGLDSSSFDKQQYLRDLWIKDAVFSLSRHTTVAIVWPVLMVLPDRYKNDPHFFEQVLQAKCEDNRRFSVENRDQFIKMFLKYVPCKLTSKMIETIAEYIKKDILNSTDIRWLFTVYFPKDIWTPHFVKTSLRRGLLQPNDIPEDKITPEIAAIMFKLNPSDTALAYRADDQSLADEIKLDYTRGLIKAIPTDRITEPVAYAAVEHGFVKDAKKRFPKKALSKRVYYRGLPYTFSLKDVPKSFRDDHMIVRAVRKPDNLRYVPNALEWLNAHKDELREHKNSKHWNASLEQEGFVDTSSGFQRITDLPHDEIKGGYTLFKASRPKEQRWFLCKGDYTVANLTIKNQKLKLDNEHPSKNLAPALRDLAERFLKNVSDISVLNRVGIYRNPDGSIRDETDRTNLPTTTVEGIDWTISPHLRGKLHTAWKGDHAILKVYLAKAHGWGGGFTKIMNAEILDYKAGLENNKAIKEGLEKICWGNPGNGRWIFHDIGICWSKRTGYWLATERKVGRIGGYTVFYNSGHRYISIYGKNGLCAHGTLLKSGKLVRDQILGWKLNKKNSDDEGDLLRKTLESISDKMTKG